jgi:putative hydrolase of the HAD superfamily
VPRDLLDARLERIAPWLAQPQSIRAIFFDAGFTLLRPNPPLPDLAVRVGAAHGISITPEAMRAHLPTVAHHFAGHAHVLRGTWADNHAITATWRAYFTDIFAPFVPTDQPDVLAACANDLLAIFESAEGWDVYPDVWPTLAALGGRYTLGVISDWGVALGPILRARGLLPAFAFLVVSATSRRAKPDPALFDLALQRADTLGDYTLYIGDTYVQDILGARAAGIHPILIDRRALLDPMQIDCPVIHSLSELPALLGLADATEEAAR